MLENYDFLEDRKKELNTLVMDLKWTYRGYNTHFITITGNPGLSFQDFDVLANDLLSYCPEIGAEDRQLYYSFYISAMLFLKLQCRPSELTFYSIYKIADAINDNIEAGLLDFSKSTYGYMLDACTTKYETKNSKAMYEAFREFEKAYDDGSISKQGFIYNIINMLDRYLYDHNFSYLHEDKYSSSIRELERFIGATQFRMRHISRQECDEGDE